MVNLEVTIKLKYSRKGILLITRQLKKIYSTLPLRYTLGYTLPVRNTEIPSRPQYLVYSICLIYIVYIEQIYLYIARSEFWSVRTRTLF